MMQSHEIMFLGAACVAVGFASGRFYQIVRKKPCRNPWLLVKHDTWRVGKCHVWEPDPQPISRLPAALPLTWCLWRICSSRVQRTRLLSGVRLDKRGSLLEVPRSSHAAAFCVAGIPDVRYVNYYDSQTFVPSSSPI